MVYLNKGERLNASLGGEEQDSVTAQKRPISFGMDLIKQGLCHEIIARYGINMDDFCTQFRLDNEGSLGLEI